ncbi:murein L,D-transpeptidase family protein [Thiomicrorhabdus indica]|uniref:L,D-transpeptidase family protein n=1 Tax=Thiomicrorhabdus indica TaxID=2267253 RepID=UPI002AA95930|nr:L,D-transpeptidase family protein [Thiomicrorhabdus indica]
MFTLAFQGFKQESLSKKWAQVPAGKKFLGYISVLFLSFFMPVAWAQSESSEPNHLHSSVQETERQLLAGFYALKNLQIEQAIEQFSELSETAPSYKLAKMLKADLLSIQAGQSLSKQRFRAHYPKTIAALKNEARVRWQFSENSAVYIPPLENFLLKSADQPYVVFVDIAHRRLHLYRQVEKHWVKLEDFYISIGAQGTGKLKEGDRRTPLGVYLISDVIETSRLPDFYGSGALPINYPNLWDRTQNRTGSGIWLHGVPSDTYARNPDASRGCVVLTNDAMTTLMETYSLPLSTPVILWDSQKRGEPRIQVVANDSVLSSLKSKITDESAEVDWKTVSIYKYPNEKSLYLVTLKTKQTNVLEHQYWRYHQSPNSVNHYQWRLEAQAQEPIEIRYEFK